MAIEFFSTIQKGMGEGHEMIIRTRGGEKRMKKKKKKGNKNKRKILARCSRGRKERAKKRRGKMKGWE